MRCYLEGYKDDRLCDLCNNINKKQHDRCKINYKLWRNNNLLLNCENCTKEKALETGTNSFGYDEDYESIIYICKKTNEECRKHMTEECLDMFINKLNV